VKRKYRSEKEQKEIAERSDKLFAELGSLRLVAERMQISYDTLLSIRGKAGKRVRKYEKRVRK